MALLGLEENMGPKEIVEWVLKCQHPNGGFSGNIDHDPHILYTLSAVQILAMCDALDRIDAELVASYFASRQLPDGSFTGDGWGEVEDDSEIYFTMRSCSIYGPPVHRFGRWTRASATAHSPALLF
jgi:geranylgeranyl transferase type-2 subunit beta